MKLIEGLERTKEATLRYFNLSVNELDKTHGPGKWPVRYLLHHLADADSVLFDRIRRIISEPRQVLWAFDQEAWANKLDYAQRPLEISKNLYLAMRAGIIYYARIHYETNGHLEFVHSTTGVRTLKDEFDKVVWHNEQHLQQIEKALV
ncbi:DinB family protein [bacterium]|nr:DinB family protein [bacterium]RIK67941.1 MAG: metal-dependent hydrolase [candidate division KSB1 bacterium]